MSRILAQLPDNFWSVPAIAKVRAPRKVVQEILLRHGKTIMAQGQSWTIKIEHLGAGAYEISLKPTN